MTIRNLKDIPTKIVSFNFPQPDFTPEEEKYYETQMQKELCEMNAKARGQDFRWEIGEDGKEHFIINKKLSFWDKLFGTF